MTAVVSHSTPADGTFSIAGATAWDAAHTITGLGTLATQNGTFSGTSSGTNTGDQNLSGLQPLDSDLTAIAALSTTSFGRALLTLADAAAGRTSLGLGTLSTQSGTFSGTSSGTNTGDQDLSGLQPLDSDLTAIAALTTTSYGRAFLALADASAGRTALGLGTMSTQNASAVAITGGTAALSSLTLDGFNDLTLVPSTTGNPVTITASGGDASVPIVLVPKGPDGYVGFQGSGSPSGIPSFIVGDIAGSLAYSSYAVADFYFDDPLGALGVNIQTIATANGGATGLQISAQSAGATTKPFSVWGGNFSASNFGSGNITGSIIDGYGLVAGGFAATNYDPTVTINDAADIAIWYDAGHPERIVNRFGLWIGERHSATNNYAIWYDSPGVYRIKGDGVMAYYNPTFTKYTPGAANYERVVQQWNANVLEYGPEAGGTGVQRTLRLIGSSVSTVGAFSVPDAAYGPGWNGSFEVPTKNAIYDKIESLGGASGDVVGPASAVNNRVVFFDGTTGKLVKDSGLTLGTIATQNASAVAITGGTAAGLSSFTVGTLALPGGAPSYSSKLEGALYVGNRTPNPTTAFSYFGRTATGVNPGLYSNLTFELEVNPTASDSTLWFGVYGAAFPAASATNTIDTLIGVEGAPYSDVNIHINRLIGFSADPEVYAGSVGDLVVFYGNVLYVGSGVTVTTSSGLWNTAPIYDGGVTSSYGLRLEAPTGSGTLVNNYGAYIFDHSSMGSSNSYNLYSAGSSSKNKFEGNLYLGGNAVIGGTVTASGKLSAQLTTEQLRLAYDASNYCTVTVSSAGNLTLATTAGSATVGLGYNTTTINGGMLIADGTSGTISFQSRLNINIGHQLGWGNGYSTTNDVVLTRDAAGVLAGRDSTNAQEFRLYRSYTDGSNYSRLAKRFNTTTALIHAEGAGTGSDGSVAFNDAVLATNATVGFVMLPSCAGAPTGTPADIPTGQVPMVYDSTNFKIYAYSGGAWKSTAALT